MYAKRIVAGSSREDADPDEGRRPERRPEQRSARRETARVLSRIAEALLRRVPR
jgi:hypothetical protein